MVLPIRLANLLHRLPTFFATFTSNAESFLNCRHLSVHGITSTLKHWRLNMLQKLTRTPNDYVLMFTRLLLGVVFFAHGAQKALGWFGGYGFSGTVGAFTQAGMPVALALFVIFVEFLGGLSMIFGLFSRLAGLGITALMLGAIATVHHKFGFFMNWFGQQKGEGYEFHLLAIALAILILVRGAGALSLDRLISKGDEGRHVLSSRTAA
jgi:putative oxidoreductase